MENPSLLDFVVAQQNKRLIKTKGFEGFCNAFGYELATHHKILASSFEEIMQRAINKEPGIKLIINMPPRHAKSTYSSVLFPIYYLTVLPGKSVISTSYGDDLVQFFGLQCKKIVTDPIYNLIFDIGLRKDSKSTTRFEMTNKSNYYATTSGGGITGKSYNLGIIDDPIKGIEYADSPNVRDKIWRWYLYDFKTRVSPGASQIVIQTRWHEDDLTGRILNSPDQNNWKVISLSALAKENDPIGRKPGEPLWPEYISLSMLDDIRNSLAKEDIRMWESLYQGNPTIEEGNYFKKTWIKTINKIPQDLVYYGASDYAVSDGKGDYTVHVIIGHDRDSDDIYVVDVWREQTESNIWVDAFLDLANKYKVGQWAEEAGQIIKSLGPYIDKEMQTRKQFVYREQFTSSADKAARARTFQASMSSGNVFILNASWTDTLTKELLAFPSGIHDDQVDALSLIGRMISDMRKRVKPIHKKTEYDMSSNLIRLPGLDEIIKPRPRR